jgi:hypothetical protein
VLSYERLLGRTIALAVTMRGRYVSSEARVTDGGGEDSDLTSVREAEFVLGAGQVWRRRIASRVVMIFAPSAEGTYYSGVFDDGSAEERGAVAEPRTHTAVRCWGLEFELGRRAEIQLLEGAYLTLRGQLASAGVRSELANV